MRIIYDLSTQPFSLGDILIYQQTSLILRPDGDKIDFVLAYDPQRPVIDDPNLRHIAADFSGNLAWLTPVTRVNEHLGEATVKTHAEVAQMPPQLSWPDDPGFGYMFYRCVEMLLAQYWVTGALPAVRPLQATRQWADDYLAKHGATVVQVRRNPRNTDRNSDYGVWIEFMRRHADERFVVVCAPHEFDDRLRLENVTIAADDVGQDTEKICALAEGASIYLGISSGPSAMRTFSKKPYCVFKDSSNATLQKMLLVSADGYAYPWGTEAQSILPCAETVDRIEREFARMKAFH